MSSPLESTASGSLGAFEYELSDELSYQSYLALFESQSGKVKEDIVRQGSPHPALPIVAAMAMLLVAMVLALLWSWDFWITRVLLVAGVLVELLLLFKGALYFWPAFRHWYVRRLALRNTRRMSSRTIRWSFFDDRLETRSALTQRTIPWTDLVRFDAFGDFWFLTLKSGLVLTVPVAVLSADLQALLREKVNQVASPPKHT